MIERIDHWRNQIRTEGWLVVILGGILLITGLLVHQFWPGSINHTNPPVLNEPPWDSTETRELTDVACFDCHSNETRWPWYTQIALVSQLIEYDVYRGREVLNFSEWDAENWTEEDLDRLVMLVTQGEMPLPYYLILHPEARYADEVEGRLVTGLIETLSPQ